MSKMLAIAELMRLDKPIGIYLLMWPALLTLVISSSGSFSYQQVFIVIFGFLKNCRIKTNITIRKICTGSPYFISK